MASQAQLDLQLAQLTAQLAQLEIQYAAADDDNDGILLKSLQYEIKQVNSQIASVEAELAAITEVPGATEVVVTTERPEARIFVTEDPNLLANNEPVGNTENIQDQKQAEADARIDAEQSEIAGQQQLALEPASAGGSFQGLQGATNATRSQQSAQDAVNAKTKDDWRVRLSLAPNANNYLYKVDEGKAGILNPLQRTNGIIFPYTPQIQVNYAAHYDPAELIHSNYRVYQYKNSSVDQITITCDFTAQDTHEANYLLATIHFLRSVTKMFYGQDQNPKPGTPPPLCYLTGLGAFQFDNHPLVISGFNYSLPNEVDYIRAGSPTLPAGTNASMYQDGSGASADPSAQRRQDSNLQAGGLAAPAKFNNPATNTEPTYVPTKMQISISAYPMVSRADISNKFSLKDYATGRLLQGSKNPGSGGIW
jgi:hypothetical protein